MITIVCATGDHVRVEADQLAGANLNGRPLHRAMLEAEDLTRTTFRNADLRGAFLARARLVEAILAGANLIVTNLDDAVLDRAVLDGARARGVELPRASLRGATLVSVDLELANLEGADLRGADLLRARLAGARFTGARADEMTRWPVDFDPIAAGVLVERAWQCGAPADPVPVRPGEGAPGRMAMAIEISAMADDAYDVLVQDDAGVRHRFRFSVDAAAADVLRWTEAFDAFIGDHACEAQPLLAAILAVHRGRRLVEGAVRTAPHGAAEPCVKGRCQTTSISRSPRSSSDEER